MPTVPAQCPGLHPASHALPPSATGRHPWASGQSHIPCGSPSREPSLPGLPTQDGTPLSPIPQCQAGFHSQCSKGMLPAWIPEVSSRVSQVRLIWCCGGTWPGALSRAKRQACRTAVSYSGLLEAADSRLPSGPPLPPFPQPAGSHVINTNCSAVHTRQALCCKMSVEYDKFIESGRKYVVPSSAPSESPGLRLGPHTWAAPLRETCSLPAGGSATWMMTTT